MTASSAIYLVIDTETTGWSPHTNGMIEFAGVCMDASLEITDSLVVDIRPPEGTAVREESLQITGFTRERIAQGMSYEDFCVLFREFIAKNFTKKPIVIGQFYPFDYAFMTSVFDKGGHPEYTEDNIFGNDFVDTKVIANLLNMQARYRSEPEPFPSTSLSKAGGLKERFGIAGAEYAAHTAMGDVLATREVLKRFVEKVKYRA